MRIVFSWEWGAGSGHLRRFLPLALHLKERGHDVIIASRDIASLPKLFPPASFGWMQSPDTGRNLSPRANAACMADIAFNLGFESSEKIAASLGVWKQIFQSVRPDLLISDFGLASLAVAHTMGIPTARIGTGYTCPPSDMHCHPMIDAMDPQVDGISAAKSSSLSLLQSIHVALRHVGLSDEIGWSEMLLPANRTLLATLPPLDPYHLQRAPSEYLGVWQTDGEAKPAFAPGNRVRAVAYLKPFRWLPDFLHMLASMGIETVLYGDGIPENLIANARGPLLKVSDQPLRFSGVGESCSFAICNANHGTTSKLLSEGVPVLAIPIYLEQRITGQAIQRLGWGVCADPQKPDSFRSAILKVLDPVMKENSVRYSNEFSQYFAGGLELACAKLDAMTTS